MRRKRISDALARRVVKGEYYSDSNYSFSPKSRDNGYQELRKKLKKYLEHKKILQIKSGWNNPKEIIPIFDVKSKQPIFKNFAMNSKRGN